MLTSSALPAAAEVICQHAETEKFTVKKFATGMQVDGVLASIILDDFFDVGESMMKAEPAIQKLCKDFGIPSMDHVAIDTWPSEHLQSPSQPFL